MNKKKILGIDMDDVLIDFVSGFSVFLEKEKGIKIKREDLTSYYSVSKILNCSKEEARKVLDAFAVSEDHLRIDPIVGVVEALQKLNNYEFIIISARPPHVIEPIKKLLNKHFGNIFSDIHLLGMPPDSTTTSGKGELAKSLGVEYFIDDALHNAEDIASFGIPVFLLDAPWNQSENLSEGITRVYSWQEIVAKII